MYQKMEANELLEQRAILRDAVNERKSKGCVLCGSYAYLQFHHVFQKKKSTEIAKLLYRGASLKRLEQEMDKCIVLCASCHEKIHNEE